MAGGRGPRHELGLALVTPSLGGALRNTWGGGPNDELGRTSFKEVDDLGIPCGEVKQPDWT